MQSYTTVDVSEQIPMGSRVCDHQPQLYIYKL